MTLSEISFLVTPHSTEIIFSFIRGIIERVNHGIDNLFLDFDLMKFFSVRTWFTTFNFVF